MQAQLNARLVLMEPTALLQGLLHALRVLPIPGLCLGQHALPT